VGFAHDTEVTLAVTVALINTRRHAHGDSGDALPDAAALGEFLTRWAISGTRTGTRAELDAVRELRPRLARIWEVDEDRAVVIVNGLLRDGRALPQLTKHDQWDYHLHATPGDAPLADRLAVEAAMAMTDVIRTKQLDRLRTCADPDCDRVLVDLSKNRSRQYCDAGCGNRLNAAAWRARRSVESPLDA
jgi:hypothetical protein